MKIHDLVDTSRAGTAHMRDVGELLVQPMAGTIPMMRAVQFEKRSNSSFAPYNYISFPESGGIKMRRNCWCRNSTSIEQGWTYLLDHLEQGLSDRLTQLNLSFTHTYLTYPANWVSAVADIGMILQADDGTYTILKLGSAMYGAIGITTGMRVRREVVVDRKRRSVTWFAKNPVTGAPLKVVTSYSGYPTLKFAGLMVGLVANQDAPAGGTLAYNYTYDNLYEDILFTENDLPTDPPRHGNFSLATLSDVVNSSHPNATVLNAPRKLTPVVTDRYTASSPVPITGTAPVAFNLRGTLLNDAAAQGKGKCVAVVVTADLKSVTGKQTCKAALQDGRSAVFRTPRTHPFQQSQGMPGIGATVAQIDVRLPNGDIDASSLTKTITLSVN
jgi:hypothetical protein